VILAAALILTLVMPEESIKLACTLGYDDGSAKRTRVNIALDGGRGVSFEDPDNLLGDERGTVSANRRGWRVKRKDGSIVLSSRVTQTGHGAQVQLTRNADGQYTGRYYVNQGMMSESAAYGASGLISCDVVSRGPA